MMSGRRGRRVRFASRPTYRCDPQVLSQIQCSPREKGWSEPSSSQKKLIDSIECSPVAKGSSLRTPVKGNRTKDVYSMIESSSPFSKRRRFPETSADNIIDSPVKYLHDNTLEYQSFIDQIECSPLKTSTPYVDMVGQIEIPSQEKPTTNDPESLIRRAKTDSSCFQNPITPLKRIRRKRKLFNSTKGNLGNQSDRSVILSTEGDFKDDVQSVEGPRAIKLANGSTTALPINSTIEVKNDAGGGDVTSEVKKETFSNFHVMGLRARLVKLVNNNFMERQYMLHDMEWTKNKKVHKSLDLAVVSLQLDQGMAVLQCLVIEMHAFKSEEAFEFEDEQIELIIPDSWATGMCVTSGNIIQVHYPFQSRRGHLNQVIIADPFWMQILSRGDPADVEQATRFEFDCPCRVTHSRPVPLIDFTKCRRLKKEVNQEDMQVILA